jgi:hypothetical protein
LELLLYGGIALATEMGHEVSAQKVFVEVKELDHHAV